MGFLNPHGALFLIAWLGLSVVLLMRERVRTLRLKRLGLKSSKILQKVILPISAMLILTVVIMRPYSGFVDISVTASGRDILVVLDISRSMFTRDVPPSRLELAQRKLRDLVRLLARSGSADRVGIVLFAGEAYTMCPLTQDYAVVDSYIEAIGGDLVGSAGSSIQAALSVASSTLRSANSSDAMILLMTDGEDSRFDAAASAKIVLDSASKLSILGIGSVAGGRIELPDGSNVRDRSGVVVQSKLNQAGLEELANLSSGRYSPVTLTDADLEALLAEAASVSRAPHAGTIRNYHELGPTLVLIALILILFCARTREFVVLGLALVIIQSTEAAAQSRNLYKGRSAYEHGDFVSVRRSFEQALASSPDNLIAIEGLADSAFKLKDFEVAAEYYEKLINQSKYPSQRYRAFYNLGNTELANSDLRNAIKHYDEALALKPNDQAAQANRSLALQFLALTPTPTASPTPSAPPSSSPPPDQEETPSESSSPQRDQTPSPNPSASASESSQQQQESASTPDSTATSDPGASPLPQTASTPQKQNDLASTPQPQSAPTPEPNSTALAKSEANAWLDSLDDTPLLVGRRRKGPPPDPEQLW